MEKKIDCSSVMEANDAELETVYIISEEELVSSFNLENQNKEIIVDSPILIPKDNSCNLVRQNVHLQSNGNISHDEKSMQIILEKDINDSVNNCEIMPDRLEDNLNINVVSRENESPFVVNIQPEAIDHNPVSANQSNDLNDILRPHVFEQNSLFGPDQNSSMVQDEMKASECQQFILKKNSIPPNSKHGKSQSFDWDLLLCPYCMIKFGKAYLLKRHIVTTHKLPKNEAPFPCYHCNSLFQQEDLLLKHCEVVHRTCRDKTAFALVKKYSTYRSKRLKKSDNGSCRKKQKLSASADPFPCFYCNASFKQEDLLQTHYEVQHKILSTAPAMANGKLQFKKLGLEIL